MTAIQVPAKGMPQDKWFGMCTTASRLCACALLACWAVHADAVDAAVANLWTYLLGCWWFRHDSLEPAVSTLTFFFAIPFFAFMDLAAASVLGAEKRRPRLAAAVRRCRTQPEHARDTSAWTPDESLGIQELLVYVVPIFTLDYLFPRREARLAEAAVPTAGLVAAEIVAGLFTYDLLFTAVHYASHHVPGLYSAVHAKHHREPVVRARDTVRLSAVEETLDVLCSVAALNMLGAHPLSRMLYDIVIVFLLCELHSGWDLPWQLQNLVPFGVCGGSVRHTLHHTDGSSYYQKFFTYIDNVHLAVTRSDAAAAA